MDEACVARDDDLDHLVLAVAHGGLVQEEEHGLEEDDQHVADLEAEHGVPDLARLCYKRSCEFILVSAPRPQLNHEGLYFLTTSQSQV
ncbi:hypothetical protein GOBAR_AA27732 [Gossypium barbadense]|uniref:Uncharacterized protein n=1 Tax=Gossypium barbadense TaxID=3634 RepID=A0A2P5WPC0_GOSBA|nr:hypothetical protein GOBAR_AA27732 [Gossypium barbadense]